MLWPPGCAQLRPTSRLTPTALSSAIIAHEIVPRHLARQIDGAREALGIGAAVRFDHHAVQSQKHAAVHLARVHLLPEQAEG